MEDPKIIDLWNHYKNGDDKALSKLYNWYVHKLFSYGLKIHGDEFLVKDCIQEVFIQMIDKRKKLEVSENSSVYLYKSLRNKLLEELRTKNRRSEIAKSISVENIPYEISSEQSTIKSEEENFRITLINSALRKLSDYQREAIFLKYSQGLEYEKIADLLGIDIPSARTLVYRSLKKVKEAISGKTQLLLFFIQSIL